MQNFFNKKLILLLVIVFLAGTLTMGCGSSQEKPNNASSSKKSSNSEALNLKVVSGTVGGVWYVGLGAVGKQITKEYPGSTIDLVAGGSTGNPLRLNSGDGDLSITQHTMAVAAGKGAEPYKKKLTNVNSIVNLRDITRLNIVVDADLPIYSIEDIAKKKYPLRLATGPVGTVSELFGKWVFKEYGITYEDIESNGGKLFRDSYNEVANLMRDGHIDMFWWTGPGEAGFIQQAAAAKKLRWIPIDEKVIETVAEKYGLSKGFVPKGYYNNSVKENVPTVIDSTEFIVRADLPENVVYKITKTVLEHREDIINAYSAWKTLDVETGWKDLGLPLHPGAEKYYKEKGYMK